MQGGKSEGGCALTHGILKEHVSPQPLGEDSENGKGRASLFANIKGSSTGLRVGGVAREINPLISPPMFRYVIKNEKKAKHSYVFTLYLV